LASLAVSVVLPDPMLPATAMCFGVFFGAI
jgi:hypothetical protein